MTGGDVVLVAGEDSLIGAALVRAYARAGVECVGTAGTDLLDARATEALLARVKPGRVFVAAGPTAGIHKNLSNPADLARENLLVVANVVHAAHLAGVPRLAYLGSSCCYPRLCEQPMRESLLHTGPVEPSSAAYAAAKMAGMALCGAYARQHGRAYFSVIPGDAFGPHDDFSPESSHVVAALLLRFHEAVRSGAEAVTVWGTGAARRDFIFVDDLAAALVLLMDRHTADPAGTPVNAGSGQATSIAELAAAIAAVVGFTGRVVFDTSRPDGMPVKVLDSSRLRELGWAGVRPLGDGLSASYQWFLNQQRSVRA